MKQIITQSEVKALAFSDGEYLQSEVIAKMDIDAAIEQWILPVAGEGVLEAAAEGRYEEFTESYLKPTIAAFTRCLVQSRLNTVTGHAGLAVPVGSYHKAADADARRELMHSLTVRAKALRQAMSEYLESHAGEMSEYDPKKNVLNRCSCYGGIVQIH